MFFGSSIKISHGEEILTDWFPRGGDGAIVRASVISKTSGTTLDIKVEVYTKKVADTGQGSSAGTGWDFTADGGTTGIQELIKISDGTAGMNELVRLRLTTVNGTAGDWILLRLFPVIMFDTAQ